MSVCKSLIPKICGNPMIPWVCEENAESYYDDRTCRAVLCHSWTRCDGEEKTSNEVCEAKVCEAVVDCEVAS